MKLQAKKIFHSILNQPSVQKHLVGLKRHTLEAYEHSLRVARLAILLAEENKFDEESIRLAGMAGLLHDLGKCDILDDILKKPSSLDEAEREHIKQHPRAGFLRLTEPEFAEVRKIVVAHHEYKKHPYPRNNRERRASARGDRRNPNQRLALLTQLVAAADMFDALENQRVYKQPFSKQKIAEILREEYTGDPKFIEQVISKF